MKTILFLLILFLANVPQTLGCKCLGIEEIHTKEDLKRYDFIALVKIEKLEDLTYKMDGYYSEAAIGQVRVLELFKGKYTTQKILFWGEYTSCSMGVQEGDIWIVFGNYEKAFIETSFCTHSQRYIESEDWRDKINPLPPSGLLQTLRDLYKTPTNQKFSFWQTIQYSSKDIYTETKLFIYQVFAFLKFLFSAH